MKKSLASCQCYVLHFDTKNDVELFGSISEIVNYFIDEKITSESKRNIRVKITDCIKNYEEFQLRGNFNHQCFFVSTHQMEIECRLHS